MRARALAVFAISSAVVVLSGAASAQRAPAPAPAPAAASSTRVVVSMHSTKRVRVQIAEGSTMPCDSRDNRLLFDSTLGNGEGFSGETDRGCVCLRHTTDAFPRVGWSDSRMVCRPKAKACKGRVCKPATDPTIRVDIDATKPG